MIKFIKPLEMPSMDDVKSIVFTYKRAVSGKILDDKTKEALGKECANQIQLHFGALQYVSAEDIMEFIKNEKFDNKKEIGKEYANQINLFVEAYQRLSTKEILEVLENGTFDDNFEQLMVSSSTEKFSPDANAITVKAEKEFSFKSLYQNSPPSSITLFDSKGPREVASSDNNNSIQLG